MSLGDYYLSFLIKNSYIEDEPFKQMDLYERFKDRWAEIEAKDDILHRISDNKETVFHTVRIGLPKERLLSKEVLASLIKIDMKGANGEALYNWEKGFGKEWTVAEYMRCHPEEDRKAQCKTLIGYNSSNVLKILKEMENKK